MASTPVTREMYQGLYLMEHNPDARGSQPRYTVTDRNGIKIHPKGVTTILGDVLAKDLVGWALDRMEAHLMDNFAKMVSIETADDFQELIGEAKSQPFKARDHGASVGSEAHAMIERFLKGQDVPMGSKVSDEAKNAFGAFMKWQEESSPVIIASEEVVYSHANGYCGTLDALATINGRNFMLDFKTTNSSRKAPKGVYPEYFIQMGAYAHAYKEEFPDQTVDALAVVSVRKDGKSAFVTNEDVGVTVEQCEEMFIRVLELSRFLSNLWKGVA